MIRLLFTVTLFTCASTWATTGSVYRGRCVHAGIRPASDAVGDYALTVQISADVPCPREIK